MNSLLIKMWSVELESDTREMFKFMHTRKIL